MLPSDAGSTSRPIDISDDGGRVLIWRGEDTAIGQLEVFDVAASTLTKVTVEPTTIVDAALTPDGSSVYFASPSPQVGGVAAGIHLYRTTIATRLIQLVPVDVELGTTVEIATSGQLLAQRSPDDARMIQMIDVGDGRQWTQTIESATPVSASHRSRSAMTSPRCSSTSPRVSATSASRSARSWPPPPVPPTPSGCVGPRPTVRCTTVSTVCTSR
ncbi:MAG: hypothetical protein R2710_11990 [Acidimicrobiales bacterium]